MFSNLGNTSVLVHLLASFSKFVTVLRFAYLFFLYTFILICFTDIQGLFRVLYGKKLYFLIKKIRWKRSLSSFGSSSFLVLSDNVDLDLIRVFHQNFSIV